MARLKINMPAITTAIILFVQSGRDALAPSIDRIRQFMNEMTIHIIKIQCHAFQILHKSIVHSFGKHRKPDGIVAYKNQQCQQTQPFEKISFE